MMRQEAPVGSAVNLDRCGLDHTGAQTALQKRRLDRSKTRYAPQPSARSNPERFYTPMPVTSALVGIWGALPHVSVRHASFVNVTTSNEQRATAEAPGYPPDDENMLRVILDPDDPSKSVAIQPLGDGRSES